MSCRIENGRAILPNGKESKLLEKLREVSNSIFKAEAIYESIYNSEGEFKKFYGNFEEEGQVDPLFLDENGEPILYVDNGVYGFFKDGYDTSEFYAIGTFDKEKSKVLDLLQNTEEENRIYQKELVNTLMFFINDVRVKLKDAGLKFTPDVANQLFNLDTDLAKSNTVSLKDKLLLGAFKNLSDQNQEDIDLAKELVKTMQDQGVQAMINKANEKNVTLNKDTWETFMVGYLQWESKTDKLGNIKSVGLRQLVKDSLSEYNLTLKDGPADEIISEEEDEVLRIYEQSRLEDNPRDKLSAKAKAILSNIISGVNIFGYPRVLPIDAVYSTVQKATVNQNDYKGMLRKLETMVRYSPEQQAILDRFKILESSEQAAVFTAFRNSYTKFYLFKQRKLDDGTFVNEIIDSNQNISTKKIRRDYADLSVDNLNERALYTKNEKGDLVVKPEKLKNLQSYWNTVNEALFSNTWEDYQIEALANYIWELGMDFGPTLDITTENLKKYYKLGIGTKTEGVALTDLANKAGFNLRKLLTHLESGKTINVYKAERKTVERIAETSLLFNQKPFSSFISGTLKQYYPINIPTNLDEITELFNDPDRIKELDSYIKDLKTDPLFNPGALTLTQEDSKYMSFFLKVLATPEGKRFKVKEKFINYTLDSIKRVDKPYAFDYTNQSRKASLIQRMIAHNNRGGAEGKRFALVAPHIQSDRPRLNYVEMPRPDSLKSFRVQNSERRDIIESFIIQDLARIHQATEQVEAAVKNNDDSKLIANYHYDPKSDNKYLKDGGAFKMTQIYNLNKDGKAEEAVKYLVDFLNQSPDTYTEQSKLREFINREIDIVEKSLEAFELEVLTEIETYEINLKQDVDSTIADPAAYVRSFVFNDFALRTELAKITRSGYSFSTDFSKYIKRMHLLNTPGSKLFLQGYDKSNPDYGMMPTYNALVIKDMDFIFKDDASETADVMLRNLIAANVPREQAIKISNAYRSVNKTDAQTFISLDMYRGIQQGLGKWNDDLDEKAYQEYRATGADYNRIVMPLKPYHEQLDVKNGLTQFEADKNSYVVVTPELARSFPKLLSMLKTMRENNIHVVHTESATKTAYTNAQDFNNIETLDASNPMVKNSNKLRFPQMIPNKKSQEIIFNRQIRKNLTTNIVKNEEYDLAGRQVKGFELEETYGRAIDENIKEDTNNLRNRLGVNKLRKLLQDGDRNTIEYSQAKRRLLQNLRDEISIAIEERDLPKNYLDALDIFPVDNYDHEFAIPLSFPNYAAKFEGIVSNLYNRAIFRQMLPGQEVVQIAELGGHVRSRELQMYNGSNGGSEVRIKASLLGFTKKELEGFTDEEGNPREAIPEDFDGDPRLEFIGYRVPQQGKSSAVVMKVVDFLPENYEKAIMVPGGITTQMGSDFDIDKLFLIFQERMASNPSVVIKPDYTPGAKNNRKQRNNIIYNVFKSILTDPKHLQEVLTPLSAQPLEDFAENIREKTGIDLDLNYNNPLTQLILEARNKAGKAGTGLYSNGIAGRNVAETKQVMRLKGATGFQPSKKVFFNGEVFETVGVTKDSEGQFTDNGLSMRLSASVDAGTNPVQLDLNDNKYTAPVIVLLTSVGVPNDTILNFIAQPILKEVITQAEVMDLNPGDLFMAIEKVRQKYKLKSNKYPQGSNINVEELQTNSFKDVAGNNLDQRVLNSFESYHQTGRQLAMIYKIITPDTRTNMNEISAINAYLDEENRYLYDIAFRHIEGADALIGHQNSKEKNRVPSVGVAYRRIFDVIIRDTKQLGFIQKTRAFDQFKKNLRNILNIDILNAQEHKFIDRVLYHKIMALPTSPFMKKIGDNPGLTTRETLEELYDPENANNIVTRFIKLKTEFPRLNNNIFIAALKADPSNQENGVALLQFDIGVDISTADKNNLSDALLSLIKDQNPKISEFGKLLVANQIMTHGYFPTYGSYIDLIPSEVITTDILNPGENSPVDFWKKETERLDIGDYENFDNFVHEFVRNYGTRRPGGRDLVDVITLTKKDGAIENGLLSFTRKDPRVFIKGKRKYKQYIKNKADTLFVLVEMGQDVVTYQQLEKLGIPKKLNEIGTGFNSEGMAISPDSVVGANKKMFHTTQTPIEAVYETEDKFIDFMFDPSKNIDDESNPSSGVVRGEC